MSVYTRVNGQLLNSFRGQTVCLLGKLANIAQDGMSFEMKSSDNQSVTVKLKVPLRESLSEIVEVYGNVDERGNIICVNYATFDQSAISNFDMDLYNETITMTHQLPKHYIQAV